MMVSWKARTGLKGAISRVNDTKFRHPPQAPGHRDIATARRMKDGGHIAKDRAKYRGVSRATLYPHLAEAMTA
jgi:DNA invertase Pin-like site-specific DNA recombinase